MVDERISWIDKSRAYGMFLVYAGHLFENIYYLQQSEADKLFFLMPCKFVFSFHMPLFFILAGISGHWIPKKTFRKYLINKILSRAIPYIFFNVIFVPFWLMSDLLQNGSVDIEKQRYYLKFYLSGHPYYNWVTWFVVCLLVTEIIHFLWARACNTKNKYFVPYVFFVFGSCLIWWNSISPFRLGVNYWFLVESFIAYSFYSFGLAYKEILMFCSYCSKRTTMIISFVTLLFTVITFNLNTGNFLFNNFPVVIMAGSSHGNGIYFFLTALLGSAFIISLSQVTPSNKIMVYVGQNTMPLLGLHGFFYHFLNIRIVEYFPSHLSRIENLLSVLLISLIEILMCIPIIILLNKYLYLLIGKKSKQSQVSLPQ